ncbi:hypothetical protein L1285_11740 [Pseudoalteromonas sp. DL2-H2.2]|uniref:hypothetical protein n=1 Tax=Pseudoalteromonas sp. DL2-H2.2 TaxID=2908889 RepID=UPI001F39C94A|nr:hypothetical protein [Pseudoalteromonas sp. DL2-H2.2]MCF2908990.1 hypothetical protein [Pseudoalteromonas sp. DL2-H2.2]
MTGKQSILRTVCSFSYTEELFALLDQKISEIEHAIAQTNDPDSEGLLDQAEYYVGLGFVAAQRLIVEVVSFSGLEKGSAFSIGPRHHPDVTDVSAINAAANYWKHEAEWWQELDKLSKRSEQTLEKVSLVSDSDHYHLSNLLYALCERQGVRVAYLLPGLNQWVDIIESKS